MERRLAAIMAADMAGYSRLVQQDEEGVLRRQKAHRRDLIDPCIARHSGRIVKTTGDGMLVDFGSALDAVRCAVAIQNEMIGREASEPADDRIRYRVGVNLGDVIFDEGDVFGDGVNVAARLEGLARPGGVCISDIVHETIIDRVEQPFRDMGRQRVKNISRPIRAWEWAPDAPLRRERLPDAAHQQQVRFVETADRQHLAWAAVGAGPDVLKAPNWINHLDYEWSSPCWGPFLSALAERCRLVRFDQRGNGLSDREPATISEDAMIADIGAVADAAGLGRFALLGVSQGCAFSIRYAVENPERVRCLALLGGYLRGRLKREAAEEKALYEALTAIIRDGWGSPNPVFRHFFTSSFMPDAPPEVAATFDELQRVATSPESALRIWRMNAEVDVTALAARLRAPTLVLHFQGDRVAPIEEGRLIARTIPGARFVELPGANHIPLSGSAAFDMLVEEIGAFLAQHAQPET